LVRDRIIFCFDGYSFGLRFRESRDATDSGRKETCGQFFCRGHKANSESRHNGEHKHHTTLILLFFLVPKIPCAVVLRLSSAFTAYTCSRRTIPFATVVLRDRDPDLSVASSSRPNVFIFGVYTKVADLQRDAPISR
jgi:hypothetical protein